MPRSKAEIDAEYRRNIIKTYQLKFAKHLHPEVYEKLMSVSNKNKYIIDLIRADLARKNDMTKEE